MIKDKKWVPIKIEIQRKLENEAWISREEYKQRGKWKEKHKLVKLQDKDWRMVKWEEMHCATAKRGKWWKIETHKL